MSNVIKNIVIRSKDEKCSVVWGVVGQSSRQCSIQSEVISVNEVFWNKFR